MQHELRTVAIDLAKKVFHLVGTDTLVHLRRSCYAIGPPMVDLGYETTSLYSTIDR
jgi:hypothetical protein